MKALVLGGTGTISTGIVSIARSEGLDVAAFTRSSAAIDGVRTLHGERGDAASLDAALAEGWDVVIDMIGYTTADADALVSAARGRTPHLVFASTVDVYTKAGAGFPLDESAERSPDPRFEYAHEKALSERVLEAAAKRGDFELTILRPAATYIDQAVAPVGRDFGAYMDRIRRGLPIPLHGDGSSIWVSAHRDDVARAFVSAAVRPAARGRAYNVTSDEWMTWNTYWQIAAREMALPEPLVLHIPTDDLVRLSPSACSWVEWNFQYNNIFDNRAARADLDFQTTVSWAQGARGLRRDAVPAQDAAREIERIVAAWQRRPAS